MKRILEITIRELRTIFYSPVGWLTLIIFIVHAGFVITGRIDSGISLVERNFISDKGWFTLDYFGGIGGSLFRSMCSYMYLYIPFLTMGLMSREYSSGGIKLLFSSPIRTIEIILGKYGAIMVVGMLMMCIFMLISLVVRVFVLDSVDVPLLVSGMLTCYLLIGLYAGMGLFISSLTSYQLVAGVGTFAVLFVLNSYLVTLVKSWYPEFLQLIMSVWLPSNRHLEGITGLLNSADVLYFITMAALFLTLTWLRLRFMRHSASLYLKGGIYAGVIGIFLLGGWVFSQPQSFLFFDLTAKKEYTPSGELRELKNKMPAPFTLTRYINVLEKPDLLSYTGVISTAYKLRREMKTKFDITYVPYYGRTDNLDRSLYKDEEVNSDAGKMMEQDSKQSKRSTNGLNIKELAKLAAKEYSWLNFETLPTEEIIRKRADIPAPLNRNGFIMKSGTNFIFLPSGISGNPSEQAFATSIKGMMIDKPIIGFVTGHGERNPFGKEDENYSRIFTDFTAEHALINQGFDVKEVSLKDTAIPKNVSIIVIADPTHPFNKDEYLKIRQYINNGGNIMITAAPNNRSIVNGIVQTTGLRISDSIIQNGYANLLKSSIKGCNAENKGILISDLLKSSSFKDCLIDKDGKTVSIAMASASPLQRYSIITPYSIQPLVVSANDTLVYAITRSVAGKQQRILIAGSAGFMSNGVEGVGFVSSYKTKTANTLLAVALFKWLSNDEFPVEVRNEVREEKLLMYNTGWLKLGLLVVMPFPLLMVGSILLTRRKGK